MEMTKQDRIIANVDASMGIENMPLTEGDKKRIRDCMNGKTTFQEAVDELIEKHTKQMSV